MGVTGLEAIVRGNEIDIHEEIRNHRRMQRKGRDLSKKSIIIFDLLNFMYLFLCGTVGMLGGRHQISLGIIQKFLESLKDDGADLVFFCDGQCQNSKIEEWCSRHGQKYKRRDKSMRAGSADISEQFKSIAFFESVIKMIKDKELGKVNVSTKVECDRAIVKYALDKRQEVLAIVSDDTDMLIFEGDFQLWNIDFRDRLERLERLDRTRLLRDLELSREQMKFFATIKGNEFTKRYRGKLYTEAKDVASIVKENFTSDYEYNHNLYEKVASVMFKENIVIGEEILKSIEESLKFYELVFELENFDSTINVLKLCLENGYVFQYDVDFMDFEQRCNEKYISIILQTLERACGILQLEQPDNQHLNEITVLTKTDAEGKYDIHRMAPISVEDQELTGEDIKWKSLLFVLGLQLTVKELKEIVQRSDIVVTILAILYLRQANEITNVQADALLLVHCNILRERIFLEGLTIPFRSEPDTIRSAQVFLRTFTLVTDIFHICGLDEYTHSLSYDGVYYDNLIKRRGNMERCLDAEIQAIYDRFQ